MVFFSLQCKIKLVAQWDWYKGSISSICYITHAIDESFQEIYMVETAVGQKNIPKDWTKNSGTKVREIIY